MIHPDTQVSVSNSMISLCQKQISTYGCKKVAKKCESILLNCFEQDSRFTVNQKLNNSSCKPKHFQFLFGTSAIVKGTIFRPATVAQKFLHKLAINSSCAMWDLNL
jgi:hypothetical protein